MHIYKFTHIESNKSYVGQTIQNPNTRRPGHISGSRYSKKTSGWTWSDEQKEKLQLIDRSYCKGRTWKLIDGKRVWMEASV